MSETPTQPNTPTQPAQPPPDLPPPPVLPPTPTQTLPGQSAQQPIYVAVPKQKAPPVGGCGIALAAAILSCVGLPLLVVIVLILSGSETIGSIGESIQGVVAPRPASASVVSSQTIVTGIQPLAQLVTVSVQLAQADIQIGVQSGVGNVCGFSANHVAQGTINAGVDLTQVTEDDVQYDAASDTYTITLPSPQLTSCSIDYIRQYERSTTACNVDWDEARLLAEYSATINFRDDAVEGGILTRAQAQADTYLEALFSLNTDANIRIQFAPPDPNITLPPSCQPDVPAGWQYDPTTRAWSALP
jgi:hypothetical protein